MNKTIRLFWILALAASSLVAGCSSEAFPVSYLNNLRVFAVVADPAEAGPGESVTLRPFVHIPADATIQDQSWSFCPFSAGPTAGYECVVKACEVELGSEPDGSVTANPTDLALACIESFQGSGSPPSGFPEEIPDMVEVVFRYLISDSEGTTRDTVFRFPQWIFEAPPAPNRHPIVERVEWNGAEWLPGELAGPVQEGGEGTLRVVVDESSLDVYTDEADRERTEEPILSFFTTAGRFDAGKEAGIDTEVVWRAEELEEGQTQADLWIVVRDLRGGQAVTGPYFVPIIREQ